jgi:hypothetical protein
LGEADRGRVYLAVVVLRFLLHNFQLFQVFTLIVFQRLSVEAWGRMIKVQ